MVQDGPPPAAPRPGAPSPTAPISTAPASRPAVASASRGAALARTGARLRGAAVASAVLAVLAPVGAVVAFRQGWIGLATADALLLRGTAPVLALVAVALGLLGLAAGLAGLPRRGATAALAAVAVGALVYAGLAQVRSRDAEHPPIHDVSTDWSDPPMPTVALLARRGPGAFRIELAPSVPEGPGGVGAGVMARQVAEVNARTCPAATPATFPLPPAQAYARARAALRAQAFTLVTDDPAALRLEATARRGVWALADDVMVRVRPAGAGARVDLRSISREGLNDGGANCARVGRLRRALGS